MNIDYEKIAKEAKDEHGGLLLCTSYIRAIIEAYERQKAQPEWVPLDLATVKQGQAVRNMSWPNKPENHTRKFVAAYEGGLVLEYQGYISKYGHQKPEEWLMRSSKPKTVRVRVMRRGNTEYVAMHCLSPPEGYEVVGEGDIEVRE